MRALPDLQAPTVALTAAVVLAVGCERNTPPSAQVRAPASTTASQPESTAAAGVSAPARRAEQEPDWTRLREALVREALAPEPGLSTLVLAAMRKVPRHLFVPHALRHAAYEDRPLPIGGGQTISQPYIVALMSSAADVQPGERCLEIGTGSGYQAAVLAELCAEVYSIEYLPDVASFGKANLERAGYGQRVQLRVGDGYLGWPERAPFAAIVVTAAPEVVPKPLLEQLAQGGTLVIPVGAQGQVQQLERWVRIKPGLEAQVFRRDTLANVRFVPFLGGRDKSQP